MMMLPPAVPIPGGSEFLLALFMLLTGLWASKGARLGFGSVFLSLFGLYVCLPESWLLWPSLASLEAKGIALFLGGSAEGSSLAGPGFAVTMDPRCVGLRYYLVFLIGVVALRRSCMLGLAGVAVLTAVNLARIVLLCSMIHRPAIFDAVHSLGGVVLAGAGMATWTAYVGARALGNRRRAFRAVPSFVAVPARSL